LRQVEILAAWTPPLIAVATLYFFHRLAKACFNARTAAFALFLSALTPMLIQYTLLGRPDHHCLENLPFLLALLPCLRLLGDQEVKRPWLSSLAAAAALAWGQLSWVGSFIFSLILFLCFIMPQRTGSAPEAPRNRAWLAGVFTWQVPLLLAFTAANPWVRSGSCDFDAPSLFQPLLAATLALLTWGIHKRSNEGRKSDAALALFGGGALGIFLIFESMPSFAFFAAGSKALSSLSIEMQPFFSDRGRFSWSGAWLHFGGLLFLMPIGACLLARGRTGTPGRLLLAWLGVTGLLAVGQNRYVYHFCLPACLLSGWVLDQAWKRLSTLPSPTRTAIKVPALALTLALVIPQLRFISKLPALQEETMGDTDLQETCEWLRDNTPPVRSLYADAGPPEYGVFALHSMGNEIAAIAQRPVLAGNMHTLSEQIDDSIAFFFMQDAGQARLFLKERRLRYVLLPDILANGLLSSYARIFKMPGFQLHDGPQGPELSPAMWDLTALRLYAFDGSYMKMRSRTIRPVEGFRLVYESPHAHGGVHDFKVFELVDGTPVQGRCRAGETVTASQKVTTNQGRIFTYIDETACGTGGRFRMQLPYPGRSTLSVGKRREAR
jgi:asparagine N-glycosylation enzyme membrane subunit Stt3